MWVKQYNQNIGTEGYDICLDSKGQIFITGYLSENGSDIFLLKTDSKGNRIYSISYGTVEGEKGYDIAISKADNIYITGYTGGDLDGNINTGSLDVFLTKFDNIGNKVWTKLLGSVGGWPSMVADIGFGVTTDNNNNIYIIGVTDGNFDGNTLIGYFDIFLVKYNSSGNKIWSKQIGTGGLDWGGDITSDLNNNIYITGYTEGDFDGHTNSGNSDCFIAKLDTNGNILWTDLIGSSESDNGYGIDTDDFGNVYVIGTTNGDLDGNTNQGGKDIFITKYDTNGNRIWTRQIGANDDDYGKSISVESSANFYITGTTYGNLDGNINNGEGDIFVMKFNTNGEKLWSKLVGTNEIDREWGVDVDNNGNIYVTGYTKGYFPGNYSELPGSLLLLKMREFKINKNLDKVKVYPNPSKDGTPIRFSDIPRYSLLKIYTISGNLVCTVESKDNPFIVWKLKNRYGEKVSSGVYLYVLEGGNEKQTGKICIIK